MEIRAWFHRGRHRLPRGRHRLDNPFGVPVVDICRRLFDEYLADFDRARLFIEGGWVAA